MIGVLIAILVAAVVYWLCVALGLPAIIGIVAALLVLVTGIGTGGYGMRLGGRGRY
jgi:high-affinity Fe2+/Pb2+ permease